MKGAIFKGRILGEIRSNRMVLLLHILRHTPT